MRDTIGELWIQTLIVTTSGYDILCVLTLVTRKLQAVCGRFTYRMTALLLEMSIFCGRAGCEIWMASYASKHASQSPFDKPFLRIYSVLRHITWKPQVICARSAYRTTAVISQTLFVWFTVALEIRLGSYGSRHASVVLWYNIAWARTYITNWYATTPDNKTHVPYDCILHTKRRLYC